MYDIIIEVLHALWKNGFSLTALGTAAFVLLKQKRFKKKIGRFLPWLLDDDSEVKAYINNQHLIMERLGIKWNGPESQTPIIQKSSKTSLQSSWDKIPKRRMKMREYLKKLSRTKLQAFILATIMNLALLIGYIMDVQDIQSKVDEWMPMANMGVQTILTFIYIWVEGKVDVAKAEKGKSNDDDFTTPIEPSL